MHAVFQNHLFKEIESAFVVDTLSQLHHSLPCIFRSNFVAVGAVIIINLKLHCKYLLQYYICEGFFLDCQLHQR